ncbi:hypothetical protein GALMADRAFT_159844 [Galerina marginata CBS 339.88]|uniref:DUF6534 domain-containing protein n=1 Tax=Galerina marginata (strain CBS 339.88) TaxID=685588 RepID=A0A067SIF4_GALM3|nr:hypothetical protein GALMADRAFT_159844 [Galerina marginata CBS 339.88]
MASNALPPIPPDITRTAGPLLIGYLMNWGLFGVLSTQVYFYYLAFPKDMRRTKVLVYGLYLFEMAQTIMLTHAGFATFATGFGDLNAINHIGLIWFAVPIMDSLVTPTAVAFVVQAFYAYRIAIFSQSRLMPAVILLFGFLQLGGGLATGYFGARAIHFNGFLGRKTFICTALWNGGGAICDIIIAASMTYFLSKSKTDWKPTKNIIQRLIRLIIETGTLTAAMAIVNLALSVLPGGPTYFQTTSSMLGKMYSNTMMVVLNSRARIGNVKEISTGTLSPEYMTHEIPVFQSRVFQEDEENGPGPP